MPALIALFASTFMSPRFLGIQADETYSPWPAQRLLRGDLPYRDVFTHRPPLDVLGNAAAQALLGEGLTASRLLQLASMIAVGYLLFALLRRWGATLAEAGAGALVPACVCFPFWPLPASHWQALPLACAAVLALESRPLSEDGVSPAGWVLGAGVLAGLTGLVMQPEGAAICLWLAARVWGGAAPRRELALLVAGVAIPLSLCALTLALAGIGGAAFDCLVAFPLLHYKSVFNDVTLWGSAPTTFGFVRESYGAPGVSLFVLAGLLPLAALGLALERLWRDRSRAAAAALAGVVLILGLFFKGRADWMHLMFNLPFLLIAAAQLVLSSERTLLRRAAWAWLGLP
ncbi:MAG TPA: hypothetical protein DEA08_29495, partial [Planctomycetes bacterium]|nr:hypothetical protein [Planctomycetota bacterium]